MRFLFLLQKNDVSQFETSSTITADLPEVTDGSNFETTDTPITTSFKTQQVDLSSSTCSTNSVQNLPLGSVNSSFTSTFINVPTSLPTLSSSSINTQISSPSALTDSTSSNYTVPIFPLLDQTNSALSHKIPFFSIIAFFWMIIAL